MALITNESWRSSRRQFLRAASGAAVALLAPRPSRGEQPRQPVLVCLNLVGGLDGLSAVVPFGEEAYYRARPALAVPPPGRGEGARPLQDGFGLHPALAPLHPLFAEQQLAVVHAVGGAHFGRSHFRARALMHAGGAGGHAEQDGWANRYAQLQATNDPRLFSTTRELPAAFSGPAPVSFVLASQLVAAEEHRPHLAALHRMYAGAEDPFARSADRALVHAAEVQRKVQGTTTRGKYSKNGRGLRDAARLIRADVGAEIVWVEMTGFDTHKAQGGTSGALAGQLSHLAKDIVAFRRDVGAGFRDVVLVTLTEFGRALTQNGAGGTDHGSGCSMLVIGGPVQGGRLLGRWPGLEQDTLHEGRDLAITTDYRAVLAEILIDHLGLAPDDLARVLPGFTFSKESRLGVLPGLS